MVVFGDDERVVQKEDMIFVEEDTARVFRGLKDLLVEEFDMDRVETSDRMEFYTTKPKDRLRYYAYKEKSPHTVIKLEISMDAKPVKFVESFERPEDMLKAKIKIGAKVISVYPGGEPLSWLPHGLKQRPDSRWDQKPGLKDEHRSRFQRTKLYEILVGIWHNKFYSKEIHRYEEEAEEMVIHFMNLMREKFGVEETVHRSGASHYRPPWK